MKKIFTMFFILMLVISLTACGNNNRTQESSKIKLQTADKSSTPKDNTSSSVVKNTKDNQMNSKKVKILIAYFSYEGHTRQVANWIHEQVGGDVFEIQTAAPYSSDYDTVVDQAKREQQENARPKLKAHIQNMEDYDVVFLGYPNWWNTIPMPMFTFMEEYNFSGKTIIPFCTNGGGGFGHGVEDMKSTLSDAKFLNGIEIRDSQVKDARDEVTQWVKSLNVIK
ncbi:MAG: NAD(P)H-dependent oxidoreductase [Bacillota bacterium]|nr:NAD(P)H-dependent oxidoreductase [Bacillota bacterium]